MDDIYSVRHYLDYIGCVVCQETILMANLRRYSKYFQDFMDEPGIRELSAILCQRLLVLPEGYVTRYDSNLGQQVTKLQRYFPDVHPTGGDTPLCLTESVKDTYWKVWDEWKD